MDSIEKEFKDIAIIRGGLYLYYSKNVFEVIEKCKELNKKILGIDTFIIKNNFIQPISEHSIDFSNHIEIIDTWEKAKEFILNMSNKNLLFEVVYE